MSSPQKWCSGDLESRGMINAEDLARVPDTYRVIASTMPSPSCECGCLYIVDARTKTWSAAFGGEWRVRTGLAKGKPDRELPNPFSPHGTSIQRGTGDIYALYVVNHGGREFIEFFEIDPIGDNSKLISKDFVEKPPGTWPTMSSRSEAAASWRPTCSIQARPTGSR